MYGSIHTHFESIYDTANRDFVHMLKSFVAEDCKKIAVTDHGAFSAYEDVRERAKTIEHCPEIIPGVEGYFEDSKAHIVLIAKDYEGYQSLCHIITDSNYDYTDRPIITLENLKKNVKKGHVFCTTACINGIFGQKLGLEKDNLTKKLHECIEDIRNDMPQTGLLLNREQLEHFKIAATNKYYRDIVLYEYQLGEKTCLITVKDIFDMQEETEEDRLVKQYLQILANKEIAEHIKKDTTQTKVKAIRNSENKTAIRNLEQKLEIRPLCDDAVTIQKTLKKKKLPFNKLLNIYYALQQYPTEEQNWKACKALYNKMIQIFGKNQFYFELQNHGLETERFIYPALVAFAKSVNNTSHFVASNDIHIGVSPKYLGDYADFDVLLQEEIQRRDIIQFTRFNKFYNNNDTIAEDAGTYYIKDDDTLREELQKIISEEDIIENAIENIEGILRKCHIDWDNITEQHYPKIENAVNIFEEKIKTGIKMRFPTGFPTEEYQKRVEHEKEVMISMDYVTYHLIVADYLEYGRLLGYLPKELIKDAPLSIEDLDSFLTKHRIERIGYSIGPGRGSAAGSLVCYLLGITDIDPIPYHLLFERFLNIERVSMPDIDTDFNTDIREKCIQYCMQKYGVDCVCQIMTKTYLGVKGAVRIAGRYFGNKAYLHEPAHVQNRTDLKTYLKEWYALSDGLSKQYDSLEIENEEAFIAYIEEHGTEHERNIMATAKLVIGCFSVYGQHAAGTIISSDTISDNLPLMYADKKTNMETQCNMAQAEEKGYLKMDFLGLKNLNIITDIMRATKDARLQDYREREKIITDKRIYREIYSKGLTQGVFQVESLGMKDVLTRFRPDCFEDLILLIAVYRPGPKQYIDELIAEKAYQRGEKKERPIHSICIKNEVLEEILEPTYGCIIYQEQIMQICQKLAGFTMGHADNVRRYMSKKKEAALLAEEADFVNGCMEHNGIAREEAKDLFEQMKDFGKYAFNKSHATAYAVVSLFTAYLKLYHPLEFFTVSFNAVEKLEEIAPLAEELYIFGIQLYPPDIMRSVKYFSNDGRTRIYYGLKFIKGLSGFDFVKSDDFVTFIMQNKDNISLKVFVKLIEAGVFDNLEPNIARYELVQLVNDKKDVQGKKVKGIYNQIAELDKIEAKMIEKQVQIDSLTTYLNQHRLTALDRKRINEIIPFSEKQTISDIPKKIDVLTKQMHEQEEKLNMAKEQIMSTVRVARSKSKSRDTNILKYRMREKEMLGHIFSIDKSMALLEECNDLSLGTDNTIPNLGLIILDPCVKVTEGGWIKVLCCDKNRKEIHLYFREKLPEHMTEMVLNFIPDGEYPHCYERSEIGHTVIPKIYLKHAEDICYFPIPKEKFLPTCKIYIGKYYIPYKKELAFQILQSRQLAYVFY